LPANYAEKIAMFDLCCVPSCASRFKEYPATELDVYIDNGDVPTKEDKYGGPIREIPINDAIRIIEEAYMLDNYRRYAPCLALLKSLRDAFSNELVVLHYGY
jgi:hypothetical protein